MSYKLEMVIDGIKTMQFSELYQLSEIFLDKISNRDGTKPHDIALALIEAAKEMEKPDE